MIVVCGEALMDMAPAGIDGLDAYVARAGGSPFNVAIGLARLGAAAGFLSRLSDDRFGDRLRARLLAEGVDGRFLRRGPEPTTLAFVHEEAGREPEYTFYAGDTADRLLSPSDLPDLPADVEALHLGSISLLLEPGATALAGLMAREHGRRTITLDPNVRPRLIADPEAYRARLLTWLASADVVKASRADLAWLYPGEPAGAVAERWLALGPALVAVTLGADGSEARCAAGAVRVPGRPVQVVDTVGAGDAFTAGLLAALHRGGLERARLDRLSAADVAAALREATAAAALTCARAGADPPTAAELAAYC